MKPWGSTPGVPGILPGLDAVEAGGTRGVAVKCLDIAWKADSEGSWPGRDRRSGAKAWGSNGIRYPGSPRRKRWALAVGGLPSAAARKR